MSENERIGDGIRSWVEYRGHLPTITGEVTRERGVFSRAESDYLCRACGEGWPCREALRAERDAAEAEATKRGDMLRARGVAPDDDHHPDAARDPRTKALSLLHDEMLRGAVADAQQAILRTVNVVAWHPACGPNCRGVHHEDTFVMAPGGMTVAQEAAYFAEILEEQYAATYCSHASYPPGEQDARIAAYMQRAGLTHATPSNEENPARRGEYLSGDEARAQIGEHAVVAYRIGFHTHLPIDVLRARAARYEDRARAEIAEASGA